MTGLQLSQVAIVYKESDRRSQAACQRCAAELKTLGVEVLTAPAGLYHNPYPAFLDATDDPIDLAIVLGGGMVQRWGLLDTWGHMEFQFCR